MERLGRDDRVEGAVAKRQVAGVGLRPGDARVARAGVAEDAVGEVAPDDACAGQLAPHAGGELTRTAAHVEGAATGQLTQRG